MLIKCYFNFAYAKMIYRFVDREKLIALMIVEVVHVCCRWQSMPILPRSFVEMTRSGNLDSGRLSRSKYEYVRLSGDPSSLRAHRRHPEIRDSMVQS